MLYVVIVEGRSGREGKGRGTRRRRRRRRGRRRGKKKRSAVRHLKQGPNLEGVGKKQTKNKINIPSLC